MSQEQKVREQTGLANRPSGGPVNVLLITTDEQRADAMGCYGNPHVLTPHLDRLGEQSVRFDRHTCSFPLCTPARSSILTGQYARTHGAHCVGVKLPEETRGLSHWLAEKGYATGLFGKAHFEPELSGYVKHLKDEQPYYGFQRHAITEDRAEGKYLDWIAREHPEHYRNAFNDQHESCRLDPWPPCEEGGLCEAYASDTPEALRQTGWITDRTIDFMDGQHRDGQPFFGWCSYVSPHHPWNPPRMFADLYDPASLPLPPQEAGAHGPGSDSYCTRSTMSDAEFKRMVAMYYALVSHIDHHVGRMLAWMDNRGLLDNTLVIFTSDHGDYNGDYGMIRKWHHLYDCLLRVPMLVRLPGARGGGRVHEGPTQHEDIAPAIMQYLGMDAPESVQGISFADVLSGAGTGLRKESWYEYHRTGDQIAGVERDGWKLVCYPDQSGRVLTNLRDDPREMRNLAGQAGYGEVERRLADDLLSWLLKTPGHRLPRTHGW